MNKLKLLAGDAIEIDKFCKVYPLKLSEIKEIDEQNYYSMLSILLKDDETEVDGKYFDCLGLLLALCYQNLEFRKDFLNFLSLLLKEEVSFSKDDGFYIGDIREDRIIDDDIFKEIQNIIREQNMIKTKKKRNLKVVNSKAEALLKQRDEFRKKIQEQENKNKTNEFLELDDYISIVATYVPSISIFTVFDLTIYQLLSIYTRLMMKNDFDNSYQLYTNILAFNGSNAVKDFKLNHWATKIPQV